MIPRHHAKCLPLGIRLTNRQGHYRGRGYGSCNDRIGATIYRVKPRPRKTRLLNLGVFLLLGATVNVAVAWTLPNYTRLTWSDDGPPNVDDIEWWQANAPAGREVSDAPARVIRQKAFGWYMVYMIELKRTERSQPTGHTFARRMFGWPMLSVQSSIWRDPTPRDTWRGTVFFLDKDWLMCMATGKVRRFVIVRGGVRRGRGPACAYFIAPNTCANGQCSECGAQLPPKLRRSDGI